MAFSQTILVSHSHWIFKCLLWQSIQGSLDGFEYIYQSWSHIASTHTHTFSCYSKNNFIVKSSQNVELIYKKGDRQWSLRLIIFLINALAAEAQQAVDKLLFWQTTKLFHYSSENLATYSQQRHIKQNKRTELTACCTSEALYMISCKE